MAKQYWEAPIPPFQVVDAQLATFTTLADVPLLPQITLPANILEVGSTLRITAQGNLSSTGTPTYAAGFYYGGVAGAALCAHTATATASGAASNPWSMEYWGRVRTVGSSGSIVGQGFIDYPTALTTITRLPMPITAAARTVTIDTSTAKTITVGVVCSASSGSNIFVVNSLLVELVS